MCIQSGNDHRTENEMMAQGATHFSRQLQTQRDQLITRLLAGDTGNFLKANAGILDDYFRQSFEASMIGPKLDIIRNPYAMIALGGYGRSEQSVFSDVDLLILFKKSVPRETDKLIQEVIYPLWDIGLEVGYATRSLKECLELARSDYEVLTSLLDARFICGMSVLYSQLAEQIRKKILHRRSGDIVRWLIETNRERHRRLGDSSYLLEPNLKEGRGGLRDYHTMMWIAKIKTNLRQPRDLEYQGILSHEEYRNFKSALDFVWHVRNRLHYLTGRKSDQLYFENQIRLAESMDFDPDNGQQPVEVFLGKLHGQMEFIKEQHLMFLYEQGYVRRRRFRRFAKGGFGEEGLQVVKDRLAFTSPEAILKSPLLLVKIFEESAKLKIPLGAEAKRLIREFDYLYDEQFAVSEAVTRAFEKVLITAAPTFNVLNEMLKTGFLTRLLPEFKSIVDRIQYDEYHLYPVDRHSLRAVKLLKQFGTKEDTSGDPLSGALYKSLTNRKPVLWATLLHDIGKGTPGGDHSAGGAGIAAEILARKGYKPAFIETVTFLVRHHLLLVKTATRRDINDEETAITCARQIEDARKLKMLYLLSVADCMATGPKAWTSWTASLLRDLFLKVLNVIDKGELASGEAVRTVQSKKEYLLKAGTGEEERKVLESLFDFMSPRYLLYAPAEDIEKHVNLYRQLGNSEFVWRIQPEPESDIREVTICAKDRPGLVSKIAGVFTLNGIDILETQVFTWRNHIALDIFRVKAPLDKIFEAERWERAAANLDDAISGKLDLAAALKRKLSRTRSAKPPVFGKPNRVVVDNESSSFFTIVEVFTYDFTGLLFSVTDALLRCRLDLWVAKIATYVDQVVDVFYVRDFDGQKLDTPEQVAEIRAAIEKVLPGMPRDKG